MPIYIVRIELHNAPKEDYLLLHDAMKNEGFKRDIEQDGVKYHLPTAEYIQQTTKAFNDVLESAKKAASLCKIALGKKDMPFSILINEVNGNNFRGYELEKVEA